MRGSLVLNPLVQRTRDSRRSLHFGHQWPRAADHRRYAAT
jgi:hypothetical protein